MYVGNNLQNKFIWTFYLCNYWYYEENFVCYILLYYVVIQCKLIPDWIKLAPYRILFPSQYRTNIDIILREVIYLLTPTCTKYHQMFVTIFLFMVSYHSYLKLKYSKWGNKIENKSYHQFLIIQDTTYANRQDSDDKMKKKDSKVDKLNAMVKNIMDNIQLSNSSPDKMDNQRTRILLLWSWLTIRLHHWNVEILQKMVACGLSNTRSAHQNSMKNSSIQNWSATMIWTTRTSKKTSRCVSRRLIDSDKTSFLLTSPSKYTLSLKNTISYIYLTLPILGMHRPTLPLDTHCWCHQLITPV